MARPAGTHSLLPAIHLAVSIPVSVPLPISIADRRAAPTSRPTIPRPVIKIPASSIPVVPSLVSFVPPAPVVSPGNCIPLISSGRRIPVISPMRIPVVAGNIRVDVLPIPAASATAWSPAPVSVGVIAVGGRGRAGREAAVSVPGGHSLFWTPTVARVAAAVGAVPTAESVAAERGVGAVVGTTADGATFRGRGQCGSSIVELPSVKLVAFFERGEVVGFCWVGGGAEVRMLEGVDGIDAASPVEFEEFSEKRDSARAVLPEPLRQVPRPGTRLQSLGVWKRPPAGHVLVGGCSAQLKNDLELVAVALPCKNGLTN